MRNVTKNMIKKFCLLTLKYDFMGYSFHSESELSFHHLIFPKKDCDDLGLEGGYFEWNGAILKKDTAHDYLHVIERHNRDMFIDITCEMIRENLKGYLSLDCLKRIDDVLKSFEREYSGTTDRNGESIIKEEYQRRIFKN